MFACDVSQTAIFKPVCILWLNFLSVCFAVMQTKKPLPSDEVLNALFTRLMVS